jgi:pyruvate/2-oxoglutarate dehydrogenase complex dihydrolipoamide dehydrogenase (E3) component
VAEQVDVVVIGTGPGGEDLAGRLAENGLSVVAVERELVGGECPYWGCIPSKMIIRAANMLAEAGRIDDFAGSASVTADFTPVARRVRTVATDDWNDEVAVERLEKKGARLVRGSGVITGPREVTVGERVFSTRRGIVLNTGTAPVIPPIEGIEAAQVWTNRDAVSAVSLPDTLIVLGGGAIGLELAQAFARFGVAVTVVEALPRLLPMEEPEASDTITAVLTGEGLDIRLGRKATRVSREGEHTVLALDDGSSVRGERLLVATGRRPNLRGLGLPAVGLDEGVPSIETDARMRAADGLWAIGDITGHGAFTHVSMYQAGIALADILRQEDGPRADYRAVPRVTFTDPEVGAVGMSESAAREHGIRVRTGSTQVSSSARGWIHGPGNAGFIKLVEDAEREVLIGATSMGPWGGEVLSMLSVAVHAQVPTRMLRSMIYAYPTFHRGVEDALRDLAD